MKRLKLKFVMCILLSNFVPGLANADSESERLAEKMQNDEPKIWYITPETNTAYEVSIERWRNFPGKDKARWDLLQKLYFANTKLKSVVGKKHVGCFSGDGEKLVADFFQNNANPEANKIFSVDRLNSNISTDAKAIGLTLILNGQNKNRAFAKTNAIHFRLNHCLDSGKNNLFSTSKSLKTASFDKFKDRLPSTEVPVATDEVNADGFKMFDVIESSEDKVFKDLPRFLMRDDYEKAKPKVGDRPWKDLDLTTLQGKVSFARIALKHFYDGMIDVKKDPNFYFRAQDNKKSYWCHMPWLNVGDAGREAIHGLTKERDLEPSEIYPDNIPGADWGIGYYNSYGCETIKSVFGAKNKRHATPDFSKGIFKDGTMSIKILFTTSKSNSFNGAFTWKAHVSDAGEIKRSIQDVRLLQIDVAIKDSSIKGTSAEADHWLMTSYYYDPTFTWDFAKDFENVAPGLMNMRPIGVHTGFDPATSTIFEGSKTNSSGNYLWTQGNQLLNGPADNRKSSCMGCHGVAGLKKPGMVSGMKDFATYAIYKKDAMDFSQQLAFAKRNFETKPLMSKDLRSAPPNRNEVITPAVEKPAARD